MLYNVKTESGLRARVWINNETQPTNPPIDTVSFSISGKKTDCVFHMSAVVELYLPRNLSNYALLGASYTSAPGDNLNVLIEVNADDAPVV